MSRLRNILAYPLLLLSLGLLLVCCFCYLYQWDSVAALTSFPIWIPATAGLLLALASVWPCGFPKGGFVGLLWILTALVFSEESASLANWSGSSPNRGAPTPFEGSPVLRVITLNCGSTHECIDWQSIAAYQPDLIFLQEMPPFACLREIKHGIFGDQGSMLTAYPCAILARGQLTIQPRARGVRSLFATLTRPGGQKLQLVNLHLSSSTTRLDLWNLEAWKDYRQVRANHRTEMQALTKTLAQHLQAENLPVIFGGDFNCRGTNPVFELLPEDFASAFGSAGWGWGNTYPTHFPLLRLDHLFSSKELIAERAGIFPIAGTDHRMLVADLRFCDKADLDAAN